MSAYRDTSKKLLLTDNQVGKTKRRGAEYMCDSGMAAWP